MNPEHPKVFLSHASEDKERFVVPFATALREHGVDVWLDKWEILPGDSLVDKIFEEGLKDAAAVIVVISKFSIEKPWVKEELNAAFVKRISKQTKIIPVVIDECVVPEALQATVWEKVKDISNFKTELQSVLRAIFDKRDKPQIGNLPVYQRVESHEIAGLHHTDSLVMKVIYEIAIEKNPGIIPIEAITKRMKMLEIGLEETLDSCEIILEHGYAETKKLLGANARGILYLHPNLLGFLRYADAYLPSLDDIIRKVALQIINHDQTRNDKIAVAINEPQFVVDMAMHYLANRSWIRTSRVLAGTMHVMDVSPSLRRNFSM